ncbi:MAG: arylesterase [Candidatus Puniceispirillales bacterium WSBS_2018_MAG_OTU23]
MVENLLQYRMRAMLIGVMVSFMAVQSSFAATPQKILRLLVFGDSLIAGYGLPQGVSFPDQLAVRLAGLGRDVDVINAGISGDTTAGGASRIDWSLAQNPDAVIVVLGGNDALRGLPAEDMSRNLGVILAAIQQKNIPVLLAGMRAPSNLGAEYGKNFDAAFLAAVDGVKPRSAPILFYPFFLDGVVLDPIYNQNDGIHPNVAGVGVIVQRMMPMVEQLLVLAKR